MREKLTLLFPDALWASLVAAAERDAISIAEVVRRAVRA